jgi:hypothetical protein
MRPSSALVLLALLTACGGEDPVPPPDPLPDHVALRGGLAGKTVTFGPELAEVFLTVKGPLAPDATKQVFATGQLLPFGYALAGTYTAAGALKVDGGSYFLKATTASGVLRGTYTGPSGSGQVLLASSVISVFCGTTTGPEAGSLLAVQTADGKVYGVVVATTSGNVYVLQGKRTGDALQMNAKDLSFSGTVTDNHSVAGTVNETGSWSASTDGCDTTG